MLLIVTNRQDQTADFLILELKSRKADFIRFNTEDFPTTILLNWKIKEDCSMGTSLFLKDEYILTKSRAFGIEDPSPLHLIPRYLIKRYKLSLRKKVKLD